MFSWIYWPFLHTFSLVKCLLIFAYFFFLIMVAPFILSYENSLHSQSVTSLLVISPGRVFWWQGDNLPGKRISRAQCELEKKKTQVQRFLVLRGLEALPYRLWRIGYHKEGALLVNTFILRYVWSPDVPERRPLVIAVLLEHLRTMTISVPPTF